MLELTEWSNFYVIVGGSAGALIGLQVVVLTLIAQRPFVPPEAGAAFAIPSVVHFAVALLMSAIGNAPWQAISALAICWTVVGLGGIVHTFVAEERGSQKENQEEVILEEWAVA